MASTEPIGARGCRPGTTYLLADASAEDVLEHLLTHEPYCKCATLMCDGCKQTVLTDEIKRLRDKLKEARDGKH